jgi:signal transduction histidine kinase/ActR/RegA family two-component response regulator
MTPFSSSRDSAEGERRATSAAALRLQALTARELALQAREEALRVREEHARLRDELRGAADKGQAAADVERLTDQLREANEGLVLATLQAQNMSEVADQANRLKDEFLATVSHELRTPLNAVLGWARMLGSRQLTAARAEHAIATIEHNASALAHIIDDLLDMSRIIAGGMQMERQAVDLPAVIAAAVESVQAAATAKGIQLDVVHAHDVPDPVLGDPARLQQVVSNLLTNAIKFTESGGRVTVQMERADDAIEIRVSDTGEGMGAEFLPHAFERFRQADSGITRRQGGLGLGLAIVRRIVELHGGSVRAESPGPDQGSTFVVSLPLPTGEVGAHGLIGPERVAPVVAFNDALRRLDGIRVMLVEDDADGRELLTLALEEAGAEVSPHASTRGVLAALTSFAPQVLISDLGLPDEDGYALIQQIREREAGRRSRLPAIALTGFARAVDRDRALAAGFDMHIAKPVDPAALTKVVAELAESRAP